MVSLMRNEGETDDRKAFKARAWINLNHDVASFVEPANAVNLRSKLILV